MNILHIHRYGLTGGAGGAISMRRLHFELRKAGVDSKILCVQDVDEGPYLVIRKPSLLENGWNSLTAKTSIKYGLEDIFNINSFRIKSSKAFKEADIIHFHRVPGIFSYLALPSLTKQKAAVFTLHDMWGLTGHCRHSLDCERWKTGCGKCPYTALPPAIKFDCTSVQWRLKRWVYNHSNLNCIAPSKWLAKLAKQSILNCFAIHFIPHGIDTEIYKPLEKEKCRKLLGIPPNKKILMLMAQRIGKSRILKGFQLLTSALKNVPASMKSELILLLVGHQREKIIDTLDIETINLGYVGDDDMKATAYSAADLLVSPSRAEAFGLVLLESMSCGTPLVAFGVGGTTDLVRHGITGYSAEPENAEDLCNGIIELLKHNSLRALMSEQCRLIALKEYSSGDIAQRYKELYQQLIEIKHVGKSSVAI